MPENRTFPVCVHRRDGKQLRNECWKIEPVPFVCTPCNCLPSRPILLANEHCWRFFAGPRGG